MAIDTDDNDPVDAEACEKYRTVTGTGGIQGVPNDSCD
nr:hypothetical protein [Escherichia coli]